MQNFVDSIGSELRAEHAVKVHRSADDVFAVLLFVLGHPDYKVTALVPGRELRFLVVEGSYLVQETYRLVPRGDHETLLSLSAEIEPRGVKRFAKRAIRRILLDEVADLDALKVLLDDYDGGPSAGRPLAVPQSTSRSPEGADIRVE